METGVQLSVSMVHSQFLRNGLVACMPLHELPLTRNHQHLSLQWASLSCRVEKSSVFSHSHFNLFYNDGCIHVCYCDELNHLLHMQANLNNNHQIRVVSNSEVLPFFSHSIFFSHMWQGFCKPSLKHDGYHCFPDLYVC